MVGAAGNEEAKLFVAGLPDSVSEEVLKQIFFLGNDRAAEIMLKAHVKGSAYVQTLPKPEAEKRVGHAHQAAGMQGYPLKFTVERE